MSNPAPSVSVVIPCYNRAKLISRAVTSIFAQDFDDLEIVLVDDGSSDDTRAVASAIAQQDGRVRYILHDRNKGEAAARNTGIRAARGEFIAFLDSDDEWLPGKLEAQISVLREAPDYVGGIVGNYLMADDAGEEVARDWSDSYPITRLNILAKGCGLSTGTTLVVRSCVFQEVGYFDETLPLYVDIDWLCRLTEKYEIRKIQKVVARYFKAPMRRGELMQAALEKFEAKNFQLINSYGFVDRMRIKSRFYGYISLSFAANGPWRQFIKTRFLHFLFNPVQHPGNYVHFALALVGVIPIGKRS